MTTIDPLWAELETRSRRAAARLVEDFGRCAVCRLTASGVISWSGVQWAFCETCETRWPAGSGLLDEPPVGSRDDVVAFKISVLAGFRQLPPLREDFAMKKLRFEGFEPRAFLGVREGTFLAGTYPVERSRLVAIVVQDMVVNPPRRDQAGCLDLRAWAVQSWHRIRDLQISERETVSDLLSRPEFISPISVIVDLVELVLRARARRAELQQQLEQLDVVEQFFDANGGLVTR